MYRGTLVPNTEAQRAKYIDHRNAHPEWRARADMDLGPRVQVVVSNTHRSGLEDPEEYFCVLSKYMEDNPGVVVKESQLCWEMIKGEWVQGVPWICI